MRKDDCLHTSKILFFLPISVPHLFHQGCFLRRFPPAPPPYSYGTVLFLSPQRTARVGGYRRERACLPGACWVGGKSWCEFSLLSFVEYLYAAKKDARHVRAHTREHTTNTSPLHPCAWSLVGLKYRCTLSTKSRLLGWEAFFFSFVSKKTPEEIKKKRGDLDLLTTKVKGKYRARTYCT